MQSHENGNAIWHPINILRALGPCDAISPAWMLHLAVYWYGSGTVRYSYIHSGEWVYSHVTGNAIGHPINILGTVGPCDAISPDWMLHLASPWYGSDTVAYPNSHSAEWV